MVYPLGSVTPTANGSQEVITAGGTWTAPTVAANGFTVILKSIQVIGAGGKSANAGGLDGNGASGAGGGAYSQVAASLPGTVAAGNWTATVPAAQTTAATAGGDCWFSSTGSAPTTPSQGALAKGGGFGAANAAAAGLGGAAASGIGDTKFSGGKGAVGLSLNGAGGGGAAGATGNGGDAVTTAGGAGNAPGGSGGGGAANPGTPGVTPGGGGQGGNALGGPSGAGAAGEVILTYSKQYGTQITETLTLTDTPTRRTVVARNTTETTGPASDTVTRTASHPRGVTETNATSDAPTRVAAFGRAISETNTTTDSPTRTTVVARKVTETNTTSDVPSRLIIYGRTIREYPPGVSPDFTVTFATRAISGVVKDHETGVVVPNATVKLFRTSDDQLCQTTTSATDGTYSFARDLYDPNTYWVDAYYTNASSVQVHGVSDRGISPS